MRMILCSLLAVMILGCKMSDDPEPAAKKTDDSTPQRKIQRGFAGIDVPEDEAPKAGNQQAPPTNTTPSAGNQTISKVEARLVEWPKALEQNPNLKIADNKVKGSDYLSAAASAYVSLASRAEASNFQNQLNITRELNEGNPPTFKQFTDLARQLKIQFNHQPSYRLYGYDTKTGGIVVLEDVAEKKRIYKEKGIPLEE